MDNSQVRSRIIEAAHQVKAALMERGLDTGAGESAYKIVGGVVKPRRSPFYSGQRGYKYIDDVEDHLRRLVRSFDFLNPRPGSSVFEIGPGNCYFLFICRELRGCRVAGIDIKPDAGATAEKPVKNPSRELSKYAYQLFREHFGLEKVIRHQVVTGNQPIAFGERYDAIVATRAVFNRDWSDAEYRFWLKDCYQHLHPEGRLMVYFNKIDPASLAAWPFLRPANPPDGVKKLTIISRAALGQVLGERQ